MNAFARHLPATGWQAVHHDADAGILTLPWSGTWHGTHAVLTGGTRGLGWFVQSATGRVAPALAGLGDDGTPFHLSREDGLLPLKFALKELASQSLQAASRVICHDLGSSLMGLDGLLGIWSGAEPPEKTAFAEDYASIQDLLRNLNQNLTFLHWQLSIGQERSPILPLETLWTLFSRLLPGIADKQCRMKLELGRPENISSSSTHLIFWLLAAGRLVAFLKSPGEPFNLQLAPLPNADGFRLRADAPSLRRNLLDPASCNPGCLPYVSFWLLLLIFIQGTLDFPEDSPSQVLFTFPEKELHSGPKHAVWGQAAETPSTLCCPGLSDPLALASTLLQHASTLQSLEIRGTAPEPIRGLARGLASSLYPLACSETGQGKI